MKTTLDWKCGQSLEVGILYEDSIMKYETMVEQRVFVPVGSDVRKLHFWHVWISPSFQTW